MLLRLDPATSTRWAPDDATQWQHCRLFDKVIKVPDCFEKLFQDYKEMTAKMSKNWENDVQAKIKFTHSICPPLATVQGDTA